VKGISSTDGNQLRYSILLVSYTASKAYSSYKIVGVNHLEITINLASVESSVLRTAELDESGNWRKQETAVQNQKRTEHVAQSYDCFKILLPGQFGDCRLRLPAHFA